VLAVVLQVTQLVAARNKALEVDDIYQPIELTFVGPAGRPLVVSCDEASLRPRAMPLPQLVCRTTADLPPANANGQWTVRSQHPGKVGGSCLIGCSCTEAYWVGTLQLTRVAERSGTLGVAAEPARARTYRSHHGLFDLGAHRSAGRRRRNAL